MYKYFYKVGIKRQSLPGLQSLAMQLGFVNWEPGEAYGKPSPAAMLDALAAAYNRDPAAVVELLRSVVCTQTTDQ